jgi:20S proteasome alpha/beta subunit
LTPHTSHPPTHTQQQQQQYDLSATTYSPDGKVFQTDYAQKAVDNSRCARASGGGGDAEGTRARFQAPKNKRASLPTPPESPPPPTHKRSTAIGLRCKDGVVLVSFGDVVHEGYMPARASHLGRRRLLAAQARASRATPPPTPPPPPPPPPTPNPPKQAVEKPIVSKLLVEGSGRRTFFVDHHAGALTAGLLPDGRVIAGRACDEAASYKAFYGEPIPAETLCERVGSYMHLFNLYWSMRPFGSAFLLAAYDEGDGAEPQLALVEPSGVALRYHGTAVGKGRQAAKNEIEKLKLKEMTSREAVMQAARM